MTREELDAPNAIIAAWVGVTDSSGIPVASRINLRQADAMAQAAIDALKSLGWLSPDQLAARDAEVTRMALENVTELVRAEKEKQSHKYMSEQESGYTMLVILEKAILALTPPSTGMKLVPEVPTEAMLKAGSIAFYDSKQDVLAARLPEAYRAMLAAVTVKP